MKNSFPICSRNLNCVSVNYAFYCSDASTVGTPSALLSTVLPADVKALQNLLL
jgi:hypothetical protein